MAQLDILLAQSIATERQAGLAHEVEHRRLARTRAATPGPVDITLGLRPRLHGWHHHGPHVPATR